MKKYIKLPNVSPINVKKPATKSDAKVGLAIIAIPVVALVAVEAITSRKHAKSRKRLTRMVDYLQSEVDELRREKERLLEQLLPKQEEQEPTGMFDEELEEKEEVSLGYEVEPEVEVDIPVDNEKVFEDHLNNM